MGCVLTFCLQGWNPEHEMLYSVDWGAVLRTHMRHVADDLP